MRGLRGNDDVARYYMAMNTLDEVRTSVGLPPLPDPTPHRLEPRLRALRKISESHEKPHYWVADLESGWILCALCLVYDTVSPPSEFWRCKRTYASSARCTACKKAFALTDRQREQLRDMPDLALLCDDCDIPF